MEHIVNITVGSPTIEERLQEAATEGDFNALYSLIGEEADVLKRIDKKPFAQTPLHAAAIAGRIPFAEEMMNLMPSFARKLNKDGFSPMHLALQNKNFDLVLRLLKMDRQLARVKGREGVTPFLYVAELENQVDLVRQFLEECPECIEDATVHGDTALHIALNKDRLKTFEVLVQFLRLSIYEKSAHWEVEILNRKDGEGNTVLHIAASKDNRKAIELLADRYPLVNAKYKNKKDETAKVIYGKHLSEKGTDKDVFKIYKMIDAAEALFFRRIPSRSRYYLGSIFWPRVPVFIGREMKHLSSDMRNALLVVATLIITTTYQSSLSPPGGVWQGQELDSSPTLFNATCIKSNTNSNIYNCSFQHLSIISSINHGRINRQIINGVIPNSTTTNHVHIPAGATVMKQEIFPLFWLFNTLTLGASLALTGFLLPLGYFSLLLLVPLSLLLSNYMLSMGILSPIQFWSSVSFYLSPIITLLPLLLTLLCLLTRHLLRRKSMMPKLVSHQPAIHKMLLFIPGFICYGLGAYLFIQLYLTDITKRY